METYDIPLTEEQFKELNTIYPRSTVSAATGKRAEEILKIYFQSIDTNARFEEPEKGADIRVVLSGRSFDIEVKGTSKSNIAWSQLKVSSQPSHDRLASGLPLYRVVGVYEQNPRLYILSHDEDFQLVPESRWAVKPRRA